MTWSTDTTWSIYQNIIHGREARTVPVTCFAYKSEQRLFIKYQLSSQNNQQEQPISLLDHAIYLLVLLLVL